MLVEDLENLASKAFSSMKEEQALGIKNAINEVKSLQLKQSALQVGDKVEDFELSNIYEEKKEFKITFKNKIIFL